MRDLGGDPVPPSPYGEGVGAEHLIPREQNIALSP